MAPKGKTTPERLIVLETNMENIQKGQEDMKAMILRKFESIEAKIDMRNKIEEIHTIVSQPVPATPRTALEKWGNAGRNIAAILVAGAMLVMILSLVIQNKFANLFL